MRLRLTLPLVLAAVAAGAAARAADAPPPELGRLFPQEAEVFADREGLARLILPPEILGACRPDLADLRLFDARGAEIPFLVDRGRDTATTVEFKETYEPRIVGTTRSTVERKNAPALRRETFDLALPSAAPRAGSWVLEMRARQNELVARVTVEGIESGGNTVALVDQDSIFRLPGPPAAEKMRLALPPFRGARLRVVIETEHPFWIAPSFRLEGARELDRGRRIAVPLEILSSRTADGRTTVTLRRPPGIVPDLLKIDTTTGTFDRRVEAWDEGPAGVDAGLGTGRVFRVQAIAPVGEQEVAVRPARGDRLRVEIDDGDSPPLADLAFASVVRQPALIFPATVPPRAGAAGLIRFGGGRARLPRYDLAGLLPAPDRAATGRRAEAASLLYDPATVASARVGAPRPNPAFDGAPVLAFAMHPGAGLDLRTFSHRRTLTVPDAGDGLSRLRLLPEDLAVLSDDLSDLRVADDQSRQWPYLVDPDAASEMVALAVEPSGRATGISRYVLRPPVGSIRLDRMLLDSDTGFFDRGFTLEARLPGGETRRLARGRLARAVGDGRPATLEFASARVASLALIVEDGDDAPLVFRSVTAHVPLPEIYLTAPAGRYSLMIGSPGERPPRYELERARDVVLAVRAEPIAAGPLEENRDYSLQARLSGRGLRGSVLLWGVLAAAVLILSFLTLRLARREPPAPPA